MRSQSEVVLIKIETGLQQFAADEVVLVFYCANVNGFRVRGICGSGTEQGKSGILIVQIVIKKTGSDDVTRIDISLNLCQVSCAPVMISIFAGGKLRNDQVVILAVETVEKPRFSLDDRA